MSVVVSTILFLITLQFPEYQLWEENYLAADYEDAVSISEKRVATDSTDADALAALALASMGMLPPDTAAGNLPEKAVELDSLSALAWTALGISLIAGEDYADAEIALLQALILDSRTGIAEDGLGYLSELRGETEEAVGYYLAALEMAPEDSIARSRLRIMSSDEYVHFHTSVSEETGFSLSAYLNLSNWMGNHNTLTFDWSLASDYVFSQRGNSVDIDIDAVYDIDRDEETLQRDEGNISISGDVWFSDVTYLEANSSWNRQRLTEREWQITAFVAGGWCSWITEWLYFAPEVGIGLVSTKWNEIIDENRIDRGTIFLSSGLYFNKLHTFIDTWSISANIFLPPDDPEAYITHGEIELSFQTWEPLSVNIGYDVDYTHQPVVSAWNKYQTRFYASISLDIL